MTSQKGKGFFSSAATLGEKGKGFFSSVTTLGEKCIQIYDKHSTNIADMYGKLETAIKAYKDNTGDQNESISNKAKQMYSIIKNVGEKGDTKCMDHVNEFGGKVFKRVTTQTYAGFINDFYLAADEAIATLERLSARANAAKSSKEQYQEITALINNAMRLKDDIFRTIGLDPGLTARRFASERLGMDISTMLRLKKKYGDTSNINEVLSELFSGTTFSQSQYRLFIDILSRLYVAISRKKFVMSHKFEHYYNRDYPPPQSNPGSQTGGDLQTAIEQSMQCADQKSILERIATKFDMISRFYENIKGFVEFIDKYTPSTGMLEIMSTFTKRNEMYIINKNFDSSLKAYIQIALEGTDPGVHVFNSHTKSYDKPIKIDQFITESNQAMNALVFFLLDKKETDKITNNAKTTHTNNAKTTQNIQELRKQILEEEQQKRLLNKQNRLMILGFIADMIEFFQFKITCTARRGGGVEMASADNVKYTVPKSQVKYFESLGFKVGGGDNPLYNHPPDKKTKDDDVCTVLCCIKCATCWCLIDCLINS